MTEGKVQQPTKKPKRFQFEPVDIERISRMAGLGMPYRQIAAIFDMSEATFEREVAENSELADGILKGRANASEQVRATAFQMAVSGKSAVMTIFWLKCRERWKEPVDEENEEEKKRAEIRKLSTPELVKRLQAELPELKKAQ